MWVETEEDYRGKIQWDAGWETSAHPRSGKTFPRNSLKDHGLGLNRSVGIGKLCHSHNIVGLFT